MPHVWTGFGPSGTQHYEAQTDYQKHLQGGGSPTMVWTGNEWVGTPQPTDMGRMSDTFAYGRPTWVGPVEDYTTPSEDWARFMSSQQPFWSTRAPLGDAGQNLRARYLMAAPEMAAAGTSPTFSQYLSDYTPQGKFGPYAAQDYATLRQRAQQASRAAMEPTGQYLAEEGIVRGSPEWNRRAWLASQFGSDAEGAQANQLAVANLLALQREGQGTPFRGRFADAIRGAMGNLYQQRLNVGAPRESFLDWYLSQSRAT